MTTENLEQTKTIAMGSERILVAVASLLFGVMILFLVGFSQPIAVHNAAHDARHAQGNPCH